MKKNRSYISPASTCISTKYRTTLCTSNYKTQSNTQETWDEIDYDW